MLDVSLWTEQDLLELIQNEVQEDIQLDYKASAALHNTESKKREISKDVSAMANSAGGVLIYGIVEDGHIPKKLDEGFDPNETTKEWLEQIINSRIQRKINGLKIFPIELKTSNPGRFAYVVSVPQSSRAPHQAHDKKFYKRYNFESVPMEEYEIRDVSHRIDGPKLNLILEASDVLKIGQDTEKSDENLRRIKLSLVLHNESVVPAEYIAIRLYIDKSISNLSNLGYLKKQDDITLTADGFDDKVFYNLVLLHSIPEKMPIFKGTTFNMLSSPLHLDINTDGDYFISYSILSPYMDEVAASVVMNIQGMNVNLLNL